PPAGRVLPGPRRTARPGRGSLALLSGPGPPGRGGRRGGRAEAGAGGGAVRRGVRRPADAPGRGAVAPEPARRGREALSPPAEEGPATHAGLARPGAAGRAAGPAPRRPSHAVSCPEGPADAEGGVPTGGRGAAPAWRARRGGGGAAAGGGAARRPEL